MAKLTMVDGSIFEGDMVEFAEMTRIMQGDEAKETETPETETKDSLLFEGGYAKVVGETVCGDIEVGSHVKLVSEVDLDGDFQLSSIAENLDDYAKPEALVGIAKDEALESSSKVFSDGDFVALTGNVTGSVNKIGDVGIVSEADDSTCRVDTAEHKAFKRPNGGNWSANTDLRTATEDEIDKYYEEFNRLTVKEHVVYEEGDIVYYEDDRWFRNNGFGEVIGSPHNHGVVVQATGKHGIESSYYLSFDRVTLVCKADNREDKH